MAEWRVLTTYKCSALKSPHDAEHLLGETRSAGVRSQTSCIHLSGGCSWARVKTGPGRN